MDWLKKRKSRASEKKQSLVRGRERGAVLLEDVIECCDGKSNPIKFYSADQIIKATDNFSESNQVFDCPYHYIWYSGKNENSEMIIIKKHRAEFNDQRYREFCRDIAMSSMVSGHKNFLKLVGCCIESKDPVVVYHCEKKHNQVNLGEEPWKRRMKIADDIATALAYLHTAFPRPFVYRSLSLLDIILDEDGVAKLSDLSNCLSIPEGETFVDAPLMGTVGYLEPNYVLDNVVSEKTDVFAFGILMKILLLGSQRFNEIRVENKDLWFEEKDDREFSGYETKWGKNFSNCFSNSMHVRKMEEVADPEMLEKMGEVSEEELCQMKSFLMLSQRCIGLRGEVPTMVEVAKELKNIQRSL